MTKEKLIALALAAVVCAPAAGQETVPAGPAEQAVSAEELKKFFEEARIRRLSMERQQVAAEIREGLLFDPDKIEAAVEALSKRSENTWDDNAQRICQAFALVDTRFGTAWDHYRSDCFDEAVLALKAILSERDTSYFAAAKRFCHAEALARLGRNEDAVEAYLELFGAMPDRFSFAALSLLRAARTYEKMHRRFNAMQLYTAWVEGFGLLDSALAKELADRAEKIAADYSDPMGTLSRKMAEVEKRLSDADSGRTTQEKERDIVVMLDDLIASAEEQGGSGRGQGQDRQRSRRPGERDGESGRSGSRGRAGGLPAPTSPAAASVLPNDPPPEPTDLHRIRPSEPGDDWGALPPRERRKLIEAFRETMPERYREMIRDYYRALAGGGRR